MFEEYCSPSVKKIEKVFPFEIHYLENAEKNISFVLTNKCASSTLKYTLLHYGFIHTLEIPKSSKFYAIIREPSSRWISGVNEFIFAYGIKDFDKIEKHLKNSKFIFDHHTYPQYINLKNIDNVNLIKFDSCLQKQLEKICGHDIKMNNKNFSWEKKQNDYQNLCFDWFEKYAKNNSKFLDLYQKDYFLYQNA